MTCERCQGLMVGEQMCDLQGTGGNLWVEGFRCVLCGNITDAMILENRRRSTASIESILFTSPWMLRPVAA